MSPKISTLIRAHANHLQTSGKTLIFMGVPNQSIVFGQKNELNIGFSEYKISAY